MITKIRKYKNRYIAPIPKQLQKEYDLKPGDELDLDFAALNNFGNAAKPKLRITINKIIKQKAS